MRCPRWLMAMVSIVLLNSCVVLRPKIPTLPEVGFKPEKKESVVNVPIKVDFNTIEKVVNEKVPVTLFSQSGIDAGNGVKIQLEVVREGNITFSTVNGNIITSLPVYVKGQVTLNNELKLGAFGFSSKAVSINKKQSFETKLTVTATTRLRIDQAWNLRPTTTSDFVITQPPTISIMGISVSLGGIMRQKLKEQLPRLNSMIDDKIATTLNLHNEMAHYWESIRKPVLFAAEPLKIWGLFEPTQFNFAPPRSLDSKTILFNLSAKTYVQSYVGENAPQPATGALLPLTSNPSKAENFEINLPVAIELSQLKQLVQKEIVGKTFPIPSSSRTVTINDMDIYGSGNKLVVKFNVKSKGVVGDVYLIGIPQYDKETRELYMQDLDFDIQTKSLLTKKAAWLVNVLFLKKIEKKMRYATGTQIDDARAKLENSLNGMKVDDNVKISAKIKSLTIESLNTDREVIYMNANVSGNLNVAITTGSK